MFFYNMFSDNDVYKYEIYGDFHTDNHIQFKMSNIGLRYGIINEFLEITFQSFMWR